MSPACIAGAEIPVELIRQSANRAALRLFVDLYHAQSLSDFGGVHWREVRRTYDRHRVGEWGSYVVWGFRQANRFQGWAALPFMRAHLTGQTEDRPRAGGGFDRVDTGWAALWTAFELLEALDLVEMVGHVVDSDTAAGAIIHPYAMRNGEAGEQAIADAAHRAGLAMLSDAKQTIAIENKLWLLPPRKHVGEAQLVGLVRLRHRARTRSTAAWVSDSAKWSEWFGRRGKNGVVVTARCRKGDVRLAKAEECEVVTVPARARPIACRPHTEDWRPEMTWVAVVARQEKQAA